MRPILAAADLTVANLETPLTDTKSYRFEGRKSFIHWGDVVKINLHLARNHISVVTVANNHGLDYGVAGLEQTLRALDSHGIRRVGSGRTDAEVERPLLIELAGADAPLRIAVFASYLAPRTPSDAGANSGGGARIGLLDPARIAEQIPRSQGRRSRSLADRLSALGPELRLAQLAAAARRRPTARGGRGVGARARSPQLAAGPAPLRQVGRLRTRQLRLQQSLPLHQVRRSPIQPCRPPDRPRRARSLVGLGPAPIPP